MGLDPGLEGDDTDEERLGEDPAESEREKRIKKGQLARAAARERQKEERGENTSMPTRKNSIGGQETPMESRRTSIGQEAAGKNTPPGRTTRRTATGTSGLSAGANKNPVRTEQQKRKNSIDPGENLLRKEGRMSVDGEEPVPDKTDLMLSLIHI